MNWRILLRALSAIGAINWGLVGLANFNLVAYLFQSLPQVERFIYVVIGAAGVYSLYVYICLLTPKEDERERRRK